MVIRLKKVQDWVLNQVSGLQVLEVRLFFILELQDSVKVGHHIIQFFYSQNLCEFFLSEAKISLIKVRKNGACLVGVRRLDLLAVLSAIGMYVSNNVLFD